ncbi:ATP-dependent RNA helicase MAK5 [Fusarium duplospermum]|uniref:RNA helicase n=1 Tax=Fusarium duplospermum TaxID=1325734 RepID=A0A428PQZ5_9HYPO|nr:ATP-dependent RNA helicase MAK5 [Fusarium duplospermum]
MQALRVNSVGRPKRSLVCRLDTYVGCATVDTGSDLDLVSPKFANSRAFKVEPAFEQVEFADCSVGLTSGVIKTSFTVGNVNSLGFQPRGESIDLELFVLDNLNADVLVGQDTVDMLDVFNLHNESLIPSIPRLGESELNIIRHIGRFEQGAAGLWKKIKKAMGGDQPGSPDGVAGVEVQADIDQRENARRERERARIAKLSGSERQRAQEFEDMKRKLPTATGPAPKRSKNISNSKKKTNKASRRAVDASALAWKSVGEDFGGLEVIEGVDVVKDGDRVQFLVAGETNTITNDDDNEHADESFEGFGDDPVEVGDIDSGEAGSGQAGVESEKPEAKTTTKEEKASKKNKKQQRKLDAVNNKEDEQLVKTQKVVQKSSARGGNTFDALAGGEDQEEDVDVAAWVPLNLSPQILSAIAKLGFTKPTLIQEKTIPEIVAGEDVIGKAQTGSGKTLAFGIPMVEKWLELYEQGVERTGPMAVVLSPTRELAKQLGDHLKALCDGLSNAPYVCVVTGGLSIQKQQRQLEKADIVIGTPGRLWEVLSGDATLQNTFSKIKFLVVDEADRLFKVGQFKEAEDIIGALDGKRPSDDADSSDDEDDEEEGDERSARQTLVFSATFDKDLQTKLAGKGKSTGSDEEKMAYLMKCLKFRGEPKFIDVNPVSQMADGLKEGLIECGAMEKDLYLYTVLILNPGRRTLVFTNSISAVRRLTPLLSNLNMTALPLHSQMAQKARLRSLERFTAARNSVLIATDVAARGLDIKEVDQVLHYHVPRSADTYIHRSGRTARGESSGVSVILCAPEEVLPTRRLASKVHAERSSGAKREHFIQTLPVDRKMASRLKPRVDLAKKIADSVLAKEKAHSDDTWLRNAADELGVEYDSDDLEAVNASGGGRGGRGGGRRRKEQVAKGLSKAEMGALRAQLREELSRRVNLGVSERYITGGRVDVGALLREGEKGGVFLGGMDGLGFE